MGISETLGSSYRAAIEHEPPLVCVREPPYKHAPPTHSPRTCWPSYDHVPAKDQQTSKKQNATNAKGIAEKNRRNLEKLPVKFLLYFRLYKAVFDFCKGIPFFWNTHTEYKKHTRIFNTKIGRKVTSKYFSFLLVIRLIFFYFVF
ncbi:hypothetical protein ES332_D10G155900v1 [Gossypium tomentosum]|uniref:Uncharacterized protein n=1 Tax=Gossypium tomentosum TaxID=34277 RepID=A0A5D2J5M0_GOSTO|nr:hypothetical protein ES332_D10G155900v1 [Gossypium tomentosum]